MSGCLGSGGFPRGGLQRAHLATLPLAEPGQNVEKAGPEIDVEAAAGFNDRGDGGDLGSGLGTADVQPVLAAQRQGPDCVYYPEAPIMRLYVVQAATLGYVVGSEWFTLIDQASTGRFFEKYPGEAANTGLIAVSDRPWKTMLAEMMKANYDIYKVFFGEKEPFRFADPRFEPPVKKTP